MLALEETEQSMDSVMGYTWVYILPVIILVTFSIFENY